MLLATGAFTEFIKFFQIIGWIILPVLAIAGGLTTYLHYRRKKKLQAEGSASFEFDLPTPPENLRYKRSDGEYILFDHSALFRQYKRMLSYNQARYTALRHDFSALATKYSNLTQPLTLNTAIMQPLTENTNQHHEEEINLLRQSFEADKQHWQSQLAELNDSYRRLEQENQLLLERVNMETASGDERLALFATLKAEKEKLLDQISEHAYLADMLEDKKTQIGFLQEQLEQRVMASHQADRERQLALTDRENLQQELQQKESEFSSHTARQEQIIALLHEELAASREYARLVEEKLNADKQALRRLHGELALLMDDAPVVLQSPVIQLLPAYDGHDREDIAVN